MNDVFRSATGLLIIANTIAFLLEMAYPPILYYGALVPASILERPRTLITYAFLHANLVHLFFNMIFLRVLGKYLERILGPKAFLTAYLSIAVSVGILHALLSLALIPEYAHVPSIGASGAVMGVLGMSVVYLSDMELVVILFPIPIPLRMSVKQLAAVLLAVETFMAIANIAPSIAHDAHIFGLVLGYLIASKRPSARIKRRKLKEVSVFRIRRTPRFVRELEPIDYEDALCIKYLALMLSRVVHGRRVDPAELASVLQRCDYELVIDVISSFDREYLTDSELKALLLLAILRKLVKAYHEASLDVTFRPLKRGTRVGAPTAPRRILFSYTGSPCRASPRRAGLGGIPGRKPGGRGARAP